MKSFCFKILLIISCSCHKGNYSVTGAIKSIEGGKDGYNAILVNKEGKEFSVTISRIDMGIRYEELKVGDIVKIYGDSSQYADGIHIHATKIAE